jgi:transcription elongation factor GreA
VITLETIYLTKAGLAKVEAELKEYTSVKRPAMAKKLEEARKHGDLSENAEYDAAKEELGRIDAHISHLTETLSHVMIVDTKMIDTESVRLLNRLKLEDLDSGEVLNYVLVSPQEVDIDAGKISVKSPVGKALLKKKVGEIAEFTVPAGAKRLKVLDIQPPE